MGADRAVFLDRDGVINVEKEYLHRIEEFELIPGAPEAVRLLKEAGYRVVVVTNQSGVARGYYPLEAVHLLHRHLDRELALRGTSVDAYYICPHHPVHGLGEYGTECGCRKPLPGMLLKAAEDLSLDLNRSYLIGDKLSDIEAGRAAGCRSILVRTGYGRRECLRAPREIDVFDDLLEAARAIVEDTRRNSDCI
jgi:D-glycero-D-manno-heptose 1,7-bisphosphate phosphatase